MRPVAVRCTACRSSAQQPAPENLQSGTKCRDTCTSSLSPITYQYMRTIEVTVGGLRAPDSDTCLFTGSSIVHATARCNHRWRPVELASRSSRPRNSPTKVTRHASRSLCGTAQKLRARLDGESCGRPVADRSRLLCTTSSPSGRFWRHRRVPCGLIMACWIRQQLGLRSSCARSLAVSIDTARTPRERERCTRPRLANLDTLSVKHAVKRPASAQEVA